MGGGASTCYSSGRGRGNKGLKGVFGIMIERQQEESKSKSKCRCLLLERFNQRMTLREIDEDYNYMQRTVGRDSTDDRWESNHSSVESRWALHSLALTERREHVHRLDGRLTVLDSLDFLHLRVHSPSLHVPWMTE